MPELLNPARTELIPVPAQERPVARPQGPSGLDRLRPQPRQPQRPVFTEKVGPPVLILPHEPDRPAAQPVQQRREGVIRMAVPESVDPFLRRAAEDLDDAAPRLVLADYLEEIGDPHHLILRHARPSAWEPNDGFLRHRGTVADGSRHGDYHTFLAESNRPHEVRVMWWPSVRGETNNDKHPVWAAYLSPQDAVAVRDHAVASGDSASPMPWLDEMAGRAPERFAATQAPPGDMLVRGIAYKNGQFLPAPMPGPPAALPAPRRRTRLREALRRPSAKLDRDHD